MMKSGIKANEIAIIYRDNRSSLPFVSELTRVKISFYCTSRIDDIHEKEIFKDIQAYFHMTRAGADSDARYVKWVLLRPLKYLKLTDYNCRFVKDEMTKGCRKAKKTVQAQEYILSLFD